jgi:drug/metabolite transporter (DMT)-like permease
MYLIGTEKLTPVLGTVRFTAWAMIISTVAVVLHYLILESDTKIFDLDQEVYLLSLLMAVFATVIPSFFISEGIRLIGSGSASIIGSVGPVSTIILAYIFLGEVITLYQLAGTILVLTGVWIVSGSDETFEERIKKLKKVIKI